VLYTGRTWDPALGLYDYRNRQYDPALGRFTTPDPLGPTADWNNLGNPYTYTAANPGAFVDPYGYWGIQFGDDGFNLGVGDPSLIFGSDALLGANQGAMVVADTLLPGAPYREAGYYGEDDPGIRAAQFSAGIGVGSGVTAAVLPVLVPAAATGTVASGVSAAGAAAETGILSTAVGIQTAGGRAAQCIHKGTQRIAGAVTRHPDGVPTRSLPAQANSLGPGAPTVVRTPWGSRSIATGQFVPGERAGLDPAKAFVAQAEQRGFDVLGEEVTIRTPFGARVVDAVLRSPSGEIGGVEVKSSPGAFNALYRAQFAKDRWISRFGGKAVGSNVEGIPKDSRKIHSMIKILWE